MTMRGKGLSPLEKNPGAATVLSLSLDNKVLENFHGLRKMSVMYHHLTSFCSITANEHENTMKNSLLTEYRYVNFKFMSMYHCAQSAQVIFSLFLSQIKYQLLSSLHTHLICTNFTLLLTFTWPHLNSDVGLEEGEY